MSAFRAALRIARRDAWRARWRSLLVVVLIGLPVLALTAVDVGWRTYQLSPAEQLNRSIGAATLAVEAGPGGVIQQAPSGWIGDAGYGVTLPAKGSHPKPPTLAGLRAELPTGSRVIDFVHGANQFGIRTNSGVAYSSVIGLNYADPIAHGLVTQLAGRAPRAVGEVAITRAFAAQTDLQVGERMTTFDGSASYRVVGIVQDTTNRQDIAIYTLPATLQTQAAPATSFTTWLVHTTRPVSWQQVQALNQRGYVAVSRAADLNPPPASEVPYGRGEDTGTATSTVTSVGLVAGMALLEVVLLAGPAFAVSARRRRHDLALVGATGGRRRDLRNVVLADGIVLGVTAGILGALAGIGTAALGLAAFGGRVGTIPGPFDVRPVEIAGIAVVSLVTAVLASLVPAWAASRTDIVAALAGRRGQRPATRRVPMLGLVIGALGVVLAAIGAGAGRNVNVILAGVVVTELGLVIVTPTLLSLLARTGRWLPFGPRLALRDAARNRSASAPAVAAVMAAMIGAAAIAIVATSQTSLLQRQYRPALATDVAYVPVSASYPGQPAPATPASIQSALRSHLSTTSVASVAVPGQPSCSTTQSAASTCVSSFIQVQIDVDGQPARTTNNEFSPYFGQVMVANAAGADAIFGVRVSGAAAVLSRGGAVVDDPRLIHDGRITFSTMSTTVSSTGQPTTTPGEPAFSVPAIATTKGFHGASAVIGPALARRLTGFAPRPTGVMALLTQRPTSAQRQAVNGSLAELQQNLQIATEDGFQNNQWEIDVLLLAAAIVAIGAAGVATALTNADSMGDLVTLGAVGASPRTRRIVSMSRAGVIAALGCVIGVGAGFVPAVAWVRRQANQTIADYASTGGHVSGPQLHVVVPWLELGAAAIGVPLVAMLGAGLFTRSGLPSERRVE